MLGIQARTEAVLSRVLPAAHIVPARLHDAMRYAVLGAGKRVRPLLAFAAGEVTRAGEERVELAAASVELIHAYSLVHDDLPCMDDDVLRRGKPTVHVEYDEATALLVGDALQSLAFQILPEIEMVRMLAMAAGSRGMAGGQQIDLESTGKALDAAELEFMHVHKTGALIRAAVVIGAVCGTALGAAARACLDRYAKAVGLAFQVVDDVLDAEATTATLGKTAGKDAENNKPTYISLLGARQARELAEGLRRDACQSLEIFGAKAERLRQVTDFIIQRNF